ncbi:MAG: hypothetical protein JHC31_14370 [Sulfurihydrogenibium sp.]|jgi:hypothetical protein|nr:hypothetical protein [Sulfurihydrogenibium sp.]
MIVYVCDLCKATVFPEDIYFIEATRDKNHYSFDLCDNCFKKLFKNVKKRKEDVGTIIIGEYEDESNL